MFNDEEIILKSAVSYCGECHKNFVENEIVFYTWFENNTFCFDCKTKITAKSNEEYLDWQKRIFKKFVSEEVEIENLYGDRIKNFDESNLKSGDELSKDARGFLDQFIKTGEFKKK